MAEARLEKGRRVAVALRPPGSLAAGGLPAASSEQGSQFPSEEWTGRPTEMGIAISVKYSEFHLKEQAALGALRAGLEDWFQRYNEWCPHAALGKLAPSAY